MVAGIQLSQQNIHYLFQLHNFCSINIFTSHVYILCFVIDVLLFYLYFSLQLNDALFCFPCWLSLCQELLVSPCLHCHLVLHLQQYYCFHWQYDDEHLQCYFFLIPSLCCCPHFHCFQSEILFHCFFLEENIFISVIAHFFSRHQMIKNTHKKQ